MAELKSMVAEIKKNSTDGLSNRVTAAEEKISELQNETSRKLQKMEKV